MAYIITMHDIKKFETLNQLINNQITGYQAADILGLTHVHISRLKHKILKYGMHSLLRIKKPSNRKIPATTLQQITDLYKNTYYDFNIMHFKDMLLKNHHIQLSYETIRKTLINYHLHQPIKKKLIHRQRRRMSKAGMLLQMDSSPHQWLASITKMWWLTVIIDDATNEILFAKFYPADGVFNNMEVIRQTIENKGLFYALYVDKASHFKTTRYGGLHVTVSVEQEETHIERALKELNIHLILANSPQAKGRVERVFRVFQDRLINELRLYGITDYNSANRYLEKKFIPYYNKRFAHCEGVESIWMTLPADINLDLVFCKKYARKVNFDNTIKFDGSIIQIPPSKYRLSFAKCVVEVCVLADNRIYIVYKGDIIHMTKLSITNKEYKYNKSIETLLAQRTYQNAETRI
jgi:hypothetical protein